MKIKILLAALFVFAFTLVANADTFTAVATGNWSSSATWGGASPGPNVSSDNIIIPSGITVTLDQNVQVDGLLSTIEVMGVLNSTTNSTLTMAGGTITGSGDIDIDALVIGTFGGSSFTGDFKVKALTNGSASLIFTSLIDLTDMLFLQAGSVRLNSGANLNLHQNATIVIKDGSLIGNGGLLSTTGNYKVTYNGPSKSTGMELEGSGTIDVTVDLDDFNNELTLSNNININGTLDHKKGKIELNGRKLTIAGNYMAASGALIMADASAGIVVKSTLPLNSGFSFDANNDDLGTLEIDFPTTGTVKLNSNVRITASLMLKKGNLELTNAAQLSLAQNASVMIDNGSIMSTNGTFVAASNYSVTYTGPSKNAGVELSGSGLGDVTINLSDNNNTLTLTTDAKVKGDLTVTSGTIVLNDNKLEIAGNFTGNTNAKIKGSAGSNITVSAATKPTKKLAFTADGQMLNNLTVNIGSGDLELETDLTVKFLTLMSGGVKLKDNSLTIDDNGSITGATTARYVKIDGTGTLKMMVGTAAHTAFAVGTATSYSPANIKINSGVAAQYSVSVVNGVWAWGTSGTNFATTRSVVDRTWNISTASTATASIDMKLEWTSAIEVNSFNRTKAYVSHYMNGNWDVVASAAATATANGTFELTRTNVTSLSPFAVADEASALTVSKPEMAAHKMYPNPVTNELICEINIDEPVSIDVTDVTGKLIYTTDGSVGANTIDFSPMAPGIYFVKVSSQNSQVIQKIIK